MLSYPGTEETEMDQNKIMEKAVEEARRTMTEGLGGPFGAAIIDPEGKIYIASNTVIGSQDPTAHAEVNAIRKACSEKGTHDLSGCVLYTTCYPCPMCLSSAIWANIKEIHYGAEPQDAAYIGFRDDYIYDFIKGGCRDAKVMQIQQIQDPTASKELFDEYSTQEGLIY